jgi:hypothetical protein
LNALFNQQQNKGLATTNALIKDLEAQNIHYAILLNNNRFTKHLFIALLKSIKLACQNQDIILVDNIYKTNAYEMLLLHMVSKSFQMLFRCFSTTTNLKTQK